jgi:RNA polymerase sigma factor (sigma-70 family)
VTLGLGFNGVLAAAQAGAAWAFQALYEDLAPVVTGYLRLHGASDPDDVASETFLGVLRNLARFTGDEDAFRSWVFTIAHRRLLDDRRRSRRQPTMHPIDVEPEISGGDVEDDALAGLGDHWVRQVLGRLSDEQREVVLLRVVADLSVEQTAAVIRKRPGAVRALQHRAIKTLRRHLDNDRYNQLEAGRWST